MAENTGTETDRVGTCTLSENDWDNIHLAIKSEESEYRSAAVMYHESTDSYKKYNARAITMKELGWRLVSSIKYETP